MLRLAIAALCLALCVALAWSQDREAPERDQQPSAGGPGTPNGPGTPTGPQGPGSTSPLLPAPHPEGSGHAPNDGHTPTAAPGEPGGLNGGGGGYEGGKEGARRGKDDQPSRDQPNIGDAPAGPVSEDDAKANIAQVVENFVANHSVDGAWRIVDKKTKKPRLLKLASVSEKQTVKKDESVYTVPVLFKDLAANQTVKNTFTVDFTPPEWKVVGARLLSPPSR